MHLLVSHAAAPGAPFEALQLPHLQAVLAGWVPAGPGDGRDQADAFSLSPPHERALARAWGWQGADGCLPWAAQAAAADGIDTGDLAWGLVTPAHWHLGTEQLSLLDPAGLLLNAEDSRALFDAVRELFTSQGWLLAWGAPLRWYAAHESLAGLPCASLDRVIGRNVDLWLGSNPRLRPLRRLQAEAQMLLHSHPLNAAREARCLLPVNSFWLSGCGVAQPVQPNEAGLDDRLRTPALAGDWPGWLRAWETLDEGPLRGLLQAPPPGARLTLCGERASLTLQPPRAGLGPRIARLFRRPPTPATLLETL
jgi:hypothetical protein